MKQNNLLLNISDQQLHQAGLTRAQARKSLAALDYRAVSYTHLDVYKRQLSDRADR